MTSQAVMKRYINALAKKNQSNAELQKLSTAILNFKKLTKEQQGKVNRAVETAYEKLQAKGVSAKKVVTKLATTPKAKTTSIGGLKAIISDLKNQLGASSFKAATTNTNIAKDIKLAAYKKGKRIVRNAGYTTNAYGRFENKVGSTYYENRANRYDANQPSTTRKYKLAKGGEVYDNQPTQMLDGYEVDFFHTKANVYANIKIPSKNPTFEDDIQIKGIGKTEEEAFKDLQKNYLKYNPEFAKGGNVDEIKVGDKFNTSNGSTFYIDQINKQDSSYPYYTIKSKPTDYPEVIHFDEFNRYLKNGFWEKVDGKFAKGGTTSSLSSIRRKYDKNEDENRHSENVVLLATNFGDAEDLKLAKDILRKHNEEGGLSSENGKKRQDLHLKLITKARQEFKKEGIEFAKGGEVSSEYYAYTKIGAYPIESVSFWKNRQNKQEPSRANIKDFLESVPNDERVCIYVSDVSEINGNLHSDKTPAYAMGAEEVVRIVDPQLNLVWSKYSPKSVYLSSYAKGGTTKTKFKVGDKVVGQFRYDYGEGLQPVSIYDYADRVKGVISNVRKINTTTMYSIKFDNGEELQYPDFAIDNFIVKSQFAKGGEVGNKVYNEMYGVGSSKYLVNFHDGEKTHKDGSPFFDIRIFKNKVEKDKFVKELKSKGFVYKYAKGGLTEHGLEVGDEIVMDVKKTTMGKMPTTIGVKDYDKEFHLVDLDKGERYAKGGEVGKLTDIGSIKKGDKIFDTKTKKIKVVDRIDFHTLKDGYINMWFDDEAMTRYAYQQYSGLKLKKYAKGGKTDEDLYIDQLASMSATRATAIKEWASSNNLSKNDLLNIIQGLGRKQITASEFTGAVLGDKTDTSSIVSYAKSNSGFKMADGGDVSNAKNKKIMEEYRVEVSDLRNQSYPRMSPSLAFKKASEYMLFRYTKEELMEAIKSDKQIEMFGMEKTWLNALNKAKKPSKMANGGEINDQVKIVAKAIFTPNADGTKIDLDGWRLTEARLSGLIFDRDSEYVASLIFESKQVNGKVKTTLGDKTYGQLLALISHAKANRLDVVKHAKGGTTKRIKRMGC